MQVARGLNLGKLPIKIQISKGEQSKVNIKKWKANSSFNFNMELRSWDVFRDIKYVEKSTSITSEKPWVNFSIRVLKVLTYILAFVLVLMGSVTSKVTMWVYNIYSQFSKLISFFRRLLMTSQIGYHKTVPFCNKDLDQTKTYLAEISTPEQVSETKMWAIFHMINSLIS